MRTTACVACSLTTIFACCNDTLPARDKACCCMTAVVAASSAGDGVEGFGVAATCADGCGSGGTAGGGLWVATGALDGVSVSGEVVSGEVFGAGGCERSASIGAGAGVTGGCCTCGSGVFVVAVGGGASVVAAVCGALVFTGRSLSRKKVTATKVAMATTAVANQKPSD